MSATIAIFALLADMPIGQVFTTRDVLGVGSRDAVDKCLQRLVKNKTIFRLANGVFSFGKLAYITPMELAEIKARAFHKEIFEHPETTAQRLGYTPKPEQKNKQPHVFATSGTGSSSFQSVFGEIQLKAVGARKRQEDRNEVGELVKSLWYLGKRNISTRIRDKIKMVWGRKSQDRLHVYRAAVPQWITEMLPSDFGTGFKSVHLSLIPHASDIANSRYHESAECKAMVQNMPPGFSLIEPPEFERSEDCNPVYADQNDSPESKCWCPDDPECICPVFTCTYCQSQPVLNNRFSIAFG